jgi:uncharacterized protein (TIGR00725 family)
MKKTKKRFNIVVSGAAVIGHCVKGIEKTAKEVGRQIAFHNCNIVTGATTGIPYLSALGSKMAGGFSIGFSPATSEEAHIKTYRLPVDAFDVMVYTGADYVGRDTIMTKSADGVIIVCGRMGTLHEFATAFETKKPVAVLEDSGGIADKIRNLLKDIPGRVKTEVIFDNDPKALVRRLIAIIAKNKK